VAPSAGRARIDQAQFPLTSRSVVTDRQALDLLGGEVLPAVPCLDGLAEDVDVLVAAARRTTLMSDRRPILLAGPTVILSSSAVRVIAIARTVTPDDQAISGGRRRRPSAAPACAGAGLAAAGSLGRAPGEPR
jgi:hypothetical protein